MKKVLMLLFVLSLVGSAAAQLQVKAGFFTGYGISSFEDQFLTARMLPFGGKLSFEPVNRISLLLSYDANIFPYIFEFFENDEKIAERRITQKVISLNLQYRFTDELWKPYIRAGLGFYNGQLKFEPYRYGLRQEADFKEAVGLSGGIGFEYTVYHKVDLDANVILHVVKRQVDLPDSEILGYNNFIFNVGLLYTL